MKFTLKRSLLPPYRPAMARLKAVAKNQVSPPMASPEKSGRKQKKSAAKDLPTLQAAHQAKEDGKETHLLSKKTRDVYARHVHQARGWLQSHYTADGTLSVATHPGEGSEIYHDPAFKNAFERCPNQCSDQALSIYLGWRGFKEKCSQSTVDGIQAAFKLMWNDALVMW